MTRINCSVNNCSHNSSNVCHANLIKIGGNGSETSSDTCCSSFLNKQLYGNLTNSVNAFSNSNQCDALVCNVATCSHNSNNLCTLNNISVNGHLVSLYTETSCGSFAPR